MHSIQFFLLTLLMFSYSFSSYVGVVGSEFRVNTDTLNDQLYPCMASRSDGSFVIAWANNGKDGSGYGIYAQRFDSNGTKTGPEFLVNTYTANDQSEPCIAMRSDGSFVIAWASYGQDGNGWGVYAQRFDASGVKIGTEFRVNTAAYYSQYHPSIAARNDGGFTVAWVGWGTANEIWAQRFNASGAKVGTEFLVHTSSGADRDLPDIAMSSDGRFVIAWQGEYQDGSGNGVFAQRFDSSGAKIGSEFQVNTYVLENQDAPDIAMSRDGRFIITWASYRQQGFNYYGIYAQRFDSGGVKLGPELQVSSVIVYDQRYPRIALTQGDSFVIAWQNYGMDYSSWGVYAQEFDAGGNRLHGEFLANTYTTADQADPDIAGLGSNGFILVWESSGQDGSGFGIYAQKFKDILVGATLSSPGGGEVWVVGERHDILWTTIGDIAEKVRLEYSVNYGPWKTLVASTANNGKFSWVVPDDPSRQCRIQVLDAVNSEYLDQTDSLFTIRPVNQPPAVTSIAVDTAVHGTYYSYSAAATDSWDPVTISFAHLPGWLTPAGNQVSGTVPQNATDTSFEIIAFDGQLSDTLQVALRVLTQSEIAYKPSSLFSSSNGLHKGDIKWVDINNDSYLDFVCMGQDKNTNLISQLYRNSSGASFALQQNLTGLFSGGLAVADYNNDRDIDVLLLGNQSIMGTQAKSFLYKNTAGVLNALIDAFDSLSESAVLCFDYDNDGDHDVVMAGADNIGALKSLAFKNMEGVFIPDTAQHLIGVTEAALAYGDLDKDMDMDLALCGFSALGPATKIYRNDNGVFKSWQNLQGVSEGRVALADYNHDGYLDLILTGNGVDSPLTKVFDNNGRGILTENTQQKIPGVYNSDAVLGDYDNNGSLDLLVSGYTGTQRITGIYLNQGNTFNPLARGVTFPGMWYGTLTLADFDKDGDLDLLMCGDSGGTEKVFRLYENTLAGYSIVNQPPAVPSGLRAMQTDSGEVTLSWNPAIDPEGSPVTYNIRLGSTAGDEDIVPTHSDRTTGWRKTVDMGNVQTDTSWKIKNLNVGRFYWSVQAVDGAYAGSPWAAERQFMILGIGAPILLSPAQGALNVPVNPVLRWASVTGATSYRAQVSTDSTFSTVAKDTSGLADTNLAMSGLVNDTLYYWRVMAMIATGSTGWSEVRHFTTIIALPGGVTLVAPAPSDTIRADSAALVWNTAAPEVTAYWLEIAGDSSMTNPVRDTALADTSRRVRSLNDNQTYWWRVRAKNAAGWGPFSAKRSFYVDLPLTRVEAPQSFLLNASMVGLDGGLIRYALPTEAYVSIRMYDIRGKKMLSEVNRRQVAGYYRHCLPVGRLTSGFYLFVFTAGEYRYKRGVVIIK